MQSYGINCQGKEQLNTHAISFQPRSGIPRMEHLAERLGKDASKEDLTPLLLQFKKNQPKACKMSLCQLQSWDSTTLAHRITVHTTPVAMFAQEYEGVPWTNQYEATNNAEWKE